MAIDANSWDEKERRRRQFRDWLLLAWDWALDKDPKLAEPIAQLIAHCGEQDYPLWEQARKLKLIGDGILATQLRRVCGVPVQTPVAGDWERQINFAPVLKLDKEIWERLYAQLGWANRDSDTKMAVPNFWLWSNQGNVIRFVVKD